MYELWTIKPANMVMTFDTAREAESVIRRNVDEQGLAILKNHAAFVGDEDSEDSDFLAENETILEAFTHLRLLEDIREAVASSYDGLDAEAAAFIEQYVGKLPPFEHMSQEESEDWYRGFFAAALHSVKVDAVKGELEIGKPLDTPVFDAKSLAPA